MKVLRIQNAYQVTTDMAAMRAFYETALQLPQKFADGDQWVQYDGGNTNFALAGPRESPAGAQGTVVVFEVDTLDGVADIIASSGGHLEGIRDMSSHGKVATCRDPEGNLFQLFCRS